MKKAQAYHVYLSMEIALAFSLGMIFTFCGVSVIHLRVVQQKHGARTRLVKVKQRVLSMSSQVDAVGEIVGGPFIGFIDSMLSVRTALFRSSVILSPALVLIKRAYDTLNRKNYETS